MIPKFLGRDCELSTSGIGARGEAIAGGEVARLVLEDVDEAFAPHGGRSFAEPTPVSLDAPSWPGRASWGGSASWAGGASTGWSPSYDDYGEGLRRWTPNGQCYYRDMSHLEVCTAEVLEPREFAAQSLSTLVVVEAARARAEERLAPGAELALSAANADVVNHDIAWGSHVNVAVTRELWELLFQDSRRPGVLGFVASAIAAGVAWFGTGLLWGRPDGKTVFSPSSRAHHLTRLMTLATTEAYHRGLLNSRREPHGQGHERLHLIGFDFALAGARGLAALLQASLAAAETGFTDLALFDPVEAVRAWSHDQRLTRRAMPACARLEDGRALTLPQYVAELTGTLRRLAERGEIPAAVAPGAPEELERVREGALHVAAGRLERAAPTLDWAAKLLHLERLSRAEGLALEDPRLRLADHDFTRTEPGRGAFFDLWSEGAVDPGVEPAEVERAISGPPEGSRAYARGMLIRRYPDEIAGVDWSWVELRQRAGSRSLAVRIDLRRLDGGTRADLEPLFQRAPDAAAFLDLLAGPSATGRAPATPNPAAVTLRAAAGPSTGAP